MCIPSLSPVAGEVRLLVDDAKDTTNLEAYLSLHQTIGKSPTSQSLLSLSTVFQASLQLVIDGTREVMEYKDLKKHPKIDLI